MAFLKEAVDPAFPVFKSAAGAQKGVNLISVAIDAPEDVICALVRALEALDGVNAQAIYAKI